MQANPIIPNWVPEADRHRISKLWKESWVDATGHAVLRRLATYDAMKTEVWEKLPPEPKGLEINIIEWALHAFTIFRWFSRPIPKTKAKQIEWAKHLKKYPPASPKTASSWALMLRTELLALKAATDFCWLRFWEGDESVTPDHVLAMLDQLSSFYLRMDKEHRALSASLPEVKRWNTKAAQKFFTEFLSQRMKDTYGQPLDSIVAALAEVAFNDRKGVPAERVRGRRRTGAAPEKSERKSR